MYKNFGQRIGPMGVGGGSELNIARSVSTCVKAAIIGSCGFWSASQAANPTTAITSIERELSIQITSPLDGETVYEGQHLAVSGRVGVDGIMPTSGLSVVYLIDVSASTDDGDARDCNNDGVVNQGDNFAPDDSAVGTVLDCEAGAVMALNDQFAGDADIHASVVAFGSRAVQVQPFVSLAQAAGSGAINGALRSLVQGGGSALTGSNTDYADLLNTTTSLLQARPADQQRIAYLLTDGGNNRPITDEAANARDAGIRIEVVSFGGSGDQCEPQSELSRIALTTGGSCRYVGDLSNLASTVSNLQYPPNGINRVEVRFNGSVPFAVHIDRLGNWRTAITASALASGANSIEATVFDYETTQATASVVVNAVPQPQNDPPSASGEQSGLPVCADRDSDPDGDGYGWENHASCIVTSASNGSASETPVSNDPAPQPGSNGGHPVCQSIASDPDGDGYGWENGASCVVAAGTAQVDNTNTSNGGGQTSNPVMNGPAVCASAASDHDNDGWGWENGQSCRVQAGAGNPGYMNMFTACVTPDTVDSQGWGWENSMTCVVPGSTASMVVD